MFNNERFRTLRDKLEGHGFYIRPLGSARFMPDAKRDDIAIFAVGGSKTRPAIGTIVVRDYGERDGIGVWLESPYNEIDQDVAAIIHGFGAGSQGEEVAAALAGVGCAIDEAQPGDDLDFHGDQDDIALSLTAEQCRYIRSLISSHAARPAPAKPKHDHIREVERQIIMPLVEDILTKGYSLSVFDGMDYAITRSHDRDAVLAEIAATDVTYLHLSDNPSPPALAEPNDAGWIMLVHGNDQDVISDYSIKLEETGIFKQAEEVAKRFD